MRARSSSGARSRRPMKRVRTPCSARSGSSRSIVSSKISISESTSGGGRSQFSVENAYTVSDSMPRSIAASTVRRSARVPSRCPASTGRPRSSAHRPFPSRMIATDAGTSPGSSSGRVRRRICLKNRKERARSYACFSRLTTRNAVTSASPISSTATISSSSSATTSLLNAATRRSFVPVLDVPRSPATRRHRSSRRQTARTPLPALSGGAPTTTQRTSATSASGE